MVTEEKDKNQNEANYAVMGTMVSVFYGTLLERGVPDELAERLTERMMVETIRTAFGGGPDKPMTLADLLDK